jgi:hypothetical protein
MSTWKQLTLTFFATLVLGLAPAGAALAQQIKVTAATPSSAYQGTIALDVVVSGSGFNPSAKVQYFVSGTTNPGGITVRSVRYNSSKELVTTIDVAETADLASFDIIVTLDDGRKGKGTTLFSVKQKPNETTLPTYPEARIMPSFTSNGGTTAATSRLYMFGGDRDGGTAIADLWSYANAGSTNAKWTYIPGGNYTAGEAPDPRKGAAWSCATGSCVLMGGVSTSYKADTWIFNESTQTWSLMKCGRRIVCPSARAFSVMAYDPARGMHVLFGGDRSGTYLADTFTFNASTRTWTQMNGGTVPPARAAAAATYVPGVGVVMFGGEGGDGITFYNDMYVWNGAAWLPVTSTVVSDPPRVAPRIYLHSMAWDPVRGAMIVAGGLFTTSWGGTNEETWYVTFSNSGGKWYATWTLASGIGCQAAASSPPDPVVHAGAPMAFDSVAGVQVFFGGLDPYTDTWTGNTVECW